jgi:hypothetical protein
VFDGTKRFGPSLGGYTTSLRLEYSDVLTLCVVERGGVDERDVEVIVSWRLLEIRERERERAWMRIQTVTIIKRYERGGKINDIDRKVYTGNYILMPPPTTQPLPENSQ